MAPIALAPPSGFQLPRVYQILAAGERLFLAPLGSNPQPGVIGGGGLVSDTTVMEIELATDKVADIACQCLRVYICMTS